MTGAAETLTDLCKRLEAFQTQRWAIDAVLEVELTTHSILDPCSGLGAIAKACVERDLWVQAIDIEDWLKHFPDLWHHSCEVYTADFLTWSEDLTETTVIMNPPFSLAADFVDHARELNARKIICFQRQAWRESGERRAWWDTHAPARTWVCGARATCWRFDLLDCHHPDGEAACANAKRKGKKHETQGCRICMGGSPTSHAWYVWERGHKGAEVTSAIYPKGARDET